MNVRDTALNWEVVTRRQLYQVKVADISNLHHSWLPDLTLDMEVATPGKYIRLTAEEVDDYQKSLLPIPTQHLIPKSDIVSRL